MNIKISFSLIIILVLIEFSYAQYTFYDCSNDTIVLGESTDFNEYEVTIWGTDTLLSQYDTIYFEIGDLVSIFISDSFQGYIWSNWYDQTFADGNIKFYHPGYYRYSLNVRDNYTIKYHIEARKNGGEHSIIRAKLQDDGGVILEADPYFDSYLWSTGDIASSIFAYIDSANIIIETKNYCNNHFTDSILIAPQTSSANFIIGEINENIRIVDKEYPIEIKYMINETIEIPIDLNGDNINDINFRIAHNHSGQGSIFSLNYKIEELNNADIIGLSYEVGSSYYEVIQLDSMEIIGNQFEWLQSGTLMYYSTTFPLRILFKKGSVKYIGFRLIENNEVLLGWIKLTGVGSSYFEPDSTCSYFEILEVAIQMESTFPSGINAIKNIDYKIYPNPTSDILNIESDTQQEWIVSLFDLNGNIYISKKINSQITQLNMENLAEGVYLISMKNKNINHIDKIIKINK